MDGKRDIRFELRVGITARLSLLLLAIIIFTVGKFRFGKGGYPIDISFNFVDAINPQSDVLIGGGVKIGHVDSIAIQDERINVRAIINSNVRIPSRSKFQILSKGLMGDKYLNVIPDMQASAKTYLAAGAQVNGLEPGDMDKAFQQLGQVADSIRNLVGDPEMRASLVGAIQSIGELSGRLDRIVERNEGHINQSMRDFSNAAEEFNRFSKKLNQFSGDLNEVLSAKNRENLSLTLQNLQTVSAGLEASVDQISQGKGALGLLIKDEQLGKDLQSLVKEIKENPWKLFWKK